MRTVPHVPGSDTAGMSPLDHVEGPAMGFCVSLLLFRAGSSLTERLTTCAACHLAAVVQRHPVGLRTWQLSPHSSDFTVSVHNKANGCRLVVSFLAESVDT